jgi:hypothetical protein
MFCSVSWKANVTRSPQRRSFFAQQRYVLGHQIARPATGGTCQRLYRCVVSMQQPNSCSRTD